MAWRWVPVVVLAVPLVFSGFVIWTVFHAFPDPSVSTTCDEVMRFADLTALPSGAHDASCEAHVWTDTSYDAEFRIPRANLDAWLRSTLPDAVLSVDCHPDTVDACTNIRLSPPARGGAAAIDVTVEYEDADVALVHFGLL